MKMVTSLSFQASAMRRWILCLRSWREDHGRYPYGEGPPDMPISEPQCKRLADELRLDVGDQAIMGADMMSVGANVDKFGRSRHGWSNGRDSAATHI